MRDIELAVQIHVAQLMRDRLRLIEAWLLDTRSVILRDDLAGICAVDDRTALAADQVKLHLLAVQFQRAGLGERSLDDVGVECAGQATVGVGDDQQVDVILARARQQRRSAFARTTGNLGRKAGDDRFQPLAIGTRGFGRGLRLAQLRGGDHLLGLGDLLGRFDRPDPDFQFLEAGHIPSRSILFRHASEGWHLTPPGRTYPA